MHYLVGYYQEAIEYYDRALTIEPYYGDALLNKANARAFSLLSVEPVMYYNEDAVVKRVNYQLITSTIIDSTSDNTSSDYEQAIIIDYEKSYNATLANDPNDKHRLDEILKNIGIVYLKHARYIEAEEEFRKGLAEVSNHPGCMYCLGIALDYLDKDDEARNSISIATQEDPTIQCGPYIAPDAHIEVETYSQDAV